jgi:hypothetical protein
MVSSLPFPWLRFANNADLRNVNVGAQAYNWPDAAGFVQFGEDWPFDPVNARLRPEFRPRNRINRLRV